MIYLPARMSRNLFYRRAFTLIELLVVIVIIFLLIGLSSVAAGRVRESARSVDCLGRLRQIGLANIAYAGENEGCMPPYLSSDGRTWSEKLYYEGEYVQLNGTLRCPSLYPKSDPYGVYTTYGQFRRNRTDVIGGVSVFDYRILGGPVMVATYAWSDGVSFSRKYYRPPTEVVMYADCISFYLSKMSQWYYFTSTTSDPKAGAGGVPSAAHRFGFVNAIFVDGHAVGADRSVLRRSLLWYIAAPDYSVTGSQIPDSEIFCD